MSTDDTLFTDDLDLDNDYPIAPVASQEHKAVDLPSASFTATDLAKVGFEGMIDTLGFFDFPTIRLQDEVFKDNQGNTYGKEIYGRATGSRMQYLVRALTNVARPGQPEKWTVEDTKHDLAYTFDGPEVPADKRITTKDLKLNEVIAEWERLGKRVVEGKPYMLVAFNLEMDDGGEEVVQLQVAPESVSRFRALVTRLKTSARGVNNLQQLSQLLTSTRLRVYVGEKVTKVVNPFNPWMFEKA